LNFVGCLRLYIKISETTRLNNDKAGRYVTACFVVSLTMGKLA